MRSALRRDSTFETRAKMSPRFRGGAGTGAAATGAAPTGALATAAGAGPNVMGRMSFRPRNFWTASAPMGTDANGGAPAGLLAAAAMIDRTGAATVGAGVPIEEAGAAVTMMLVIGR